MTDRTDRIVQRILQEPRKCTSGSGTGNNRATNPELAAEQLMAKYDFDAKMRALDLSNYDGAELFGVSECHVRAWRDTRDMRRHPPAHAIRRLQKLIEARATFTALKGTGT